MAEATSRRSFYAFLREPVVLAVILAGERVQGDAQRIATLPIRGAGVDRCPADIMPVCPSDDGNWRCACDPGERETSIFRRLSGVGRPLDLNGSACNWPTRIRDDTRHCRR